MAGAALPTRFAPEGDHVQIPNASAVWIWATLDTAGGRDRLVVLDCYAQKASWPYSAARLSKVKAAAHRTPLVAEIAAAVPGATVVDAEAQATAVNAPLELFPEVAA